MDVDQQVKCSLVLFFSALEAFLEYFATVCVVTYDAHTLNVLD